MNYRVFVYGTLLRGEPNHYILEHACFVREARTPAVFTLRDMGAFPALLADGSTAVLGEVYDVDAATLARLDRLEGHPRLYRRTPIALSRRPPVSVGIRRELAVRRGGSAPFALKMATENERAQVTA